VTQDAKQKSIEAQIKLLQKEAAALAKIKISALKSIVTLTRKHNISISDIRTALNANGNNKLEATNNKKKRRTVAVKYRGPNGETWTGRGLTPKWLVAAEKSGKKRADFAV
jgi:DNA-binding protein H-NS